jgi:RecA-family ATPase
MRSAVTHGRPLVEGILEANTVTLLTGAPASFKSMVAYHMARAIAAGEPFAERSTERRRVLYLDKENPPRTIAKRVEQWPPPAAMFVWGSSHEIDFAPLPPAGTGGDILRSMIPHLLQAEFRDWIRAEPTVLILDSFVRFHQENENDAQTMSAIWSILRWFRDNEVTVVVIHHTTTDTARPRGGSEMSAGPDMVLHVQRFDNRVLLTEQKNRDAPERQMSIEFTAAGFEPAATPTPARRRRRRTNQQPSFFDDKEH